MRVAGLGVVQRRVGEDEEAATLLRADAAETEDGGGDRTYLFPDEAKVLAPLEVESAPSSRSSAPVAVARPCSDWRRWLEFDTAEEVVADCAFEATWAERWAYIREHSGRHVAAVVSLHGSVMTWAGLWDLLQYCTIAKAWPGIDYDDSLDDGALSSRDRDKTFVLVGAVALLLMDTFHSNGVVPGQVGGVVSRFWESPVGVSLWVKWPRAIASYLAQVMMTCGIYSLLSDAAWPMSLRRDWAYAIVGVAMASAVDVVFSYAEMEARARPPPPTSSTKVFLFDHVASKTNDAAPADGDDGTTTTMNSPGGGGAPLYFGDSCCYCCRLTTRWNLSFGTRRQRPVLAFGLAVLSYLGQCLTWVGFDELLEEWLYPGVWHQWDDSKCAAPCVFGPRRWYHQLVWIGLGLALMFATGSATAWGFAIDRLDPQRPPHVHSFLVPPAGPATARSLARAFGRNVVAQTGYYLHLTAFWYLIDEDITTNSDFARTTGLTQVDLDHSSTQRNLTYVLVGFIILYASGCFWGDAL